MWLHALCGSAIACSNGCSTGQLKLNFGYVVLHLYYDPIQVAFLGWYLPIQAPSSAISIFIQPCLFHATKREDKSETTTQLMSHVKNEAFIPHISMLLLHQNTTNPSPTVYSGAISQTNIPDSQKSGVQTLPANESLVNPTSSQMKKWDNGPQYSEEHRTDVQNWIKKGEIELLIDVT